MCMNKPPIAKRVQCGEIWSFVFAKNRTSWTQRHRRAGDMWAWTEIDALAPEPGGPGTRKKRQAQISN